MFFGLRAMFFWLRALSDLFFPRTCPVCGRPLLMHESPLCLDCRADLPLTRYAIREHNPMADRFNEAVQRHLDAAEQVHAPSRWGGAGYERAAALFFYNSRAGYRFIPQRLKYHSDLGIGRYFGAMLGRELAASPLFAGVDAVVPVPLHWTRRWRRGYNQAEVLARGVAAALGARLCRRLLFRVRRTKTQTRLSVAEKARNVSGAFRVSLARLRQLLAASSAAPAVHLLLLDDVFTTGATLLACYAALRDALDALGIPQTAVRISVATLALVGPS